MKAETIKILMSLVACIQAGAKITETEWKRSGKEKQSYRFYIEILTDKQVRAKAETLPIYKNYGRGGEL